MALQAITPHISDLDNFLSHCHLRRHPNRATLIYEGNTCDTLYYIVSGSVSVVLEDNDGKEVVVAYLNPGDFFVWRDGALRAGRGSQRLVPYTLPQRDR